MLKLFFYTIDISCLNTYSKKIKNFENRLLSGATETPLDRSLSSPTVLHFHDVTKEITLQPQFPEPRSSSGSL